MFRTMVTQAGKAGKKILFGIFMSRKSNELIATFGVLNHRRGILSEGGKCGLCQFVFNYKASLTREITPRDIIK
jgi:hypothetical protein